MSYKGKRAFNNCNVKVVEFKEFVYASGSSGAKVRSRKPSEDTRIFAGASAELHCPRTEDDNVSAESQFSDHSSKLAANDSLRRIAGELLCRDCMFATMDPVGVAEQRARLLRADAERLDALKERSRAVQELIEIDPAYKDAF